MRKLTVLIHRYAGLAVAVLLLTSSLTGAAIVFSKPIDVWFNSDLLSVTPQEEQVSLDVMLENVHQALPGQSIRSIYVSQLPNRAWEFRSHEEAHFRTYVNPYTGEVIGRRDVTESLMGFLVDLHIHLLAGETGEQVMGWAGLATAVLSVLGLYLWWPKQGRWKQAFSVKWHAAPVRVWLDVHKVIGACIFVLIIMTTITGAALALPSAFTEPVLKAVTGESTRQASPKSHIRNTNDAPLDPILERAQGHFPEGRLSRVTLPDAPDGAVVIRMRLEGEIHQFGRTFLYFDRYDGSLLSKASAFDANLAVRIRDWLYPLHTGFYGGMLTRVLQIFVGLSLALLVLSGVWLWAKRMLARKSAEARTIKPI
jgi:uncharacterized iron-regulated membrane protein